MVVRAQQQQTRRGLLGLIATGEDHAGSASGVGRSRVCYPPAGSLQASCITVVPASIQAARFMPAACIAMLSHTQTSKLRALAVVTHCRRGSRRSSSPAR